LFTVDSCNSVGCVTSSDPISSNQSRVQTLPDVPEGLEPLLLVSKSSFSVDIKWKAPKCPNGLISYYILERRDLYPPLNAQSETVTFKMGINFKVKRYHFEANKSSFCDFDDLEACGLYSYRLFAFNQVIVYKLIN
jgi:hypothetical protein